MTRDHESRHILSQLQRNPRCLADIQALRAAVHLQAFLEGGVNGLELLSDERFLHRQNGCLNIVVDANNKLQVTNLLPEHHISLVYLHGKMLSVTVFAQAQQNKPGIAQMEEKTIRNYMGRQGKTCSEGHEALSQSPMIITPSMSLDNIYYRPY